MEKPKLIRITTISPSLKVLLKGQHKFMSSHFEVIGISSGYKELLDVQKEEGIRVLNVEMTRTISPLKDLISLFKLYRVLKAEKPLIVHSHTPKAGIVGMLAAKMAGVPIRLHTVAGLPLMEALGLKRKVLDFVEKLIYASASKVYPNSKGLYDFIIANQFTTAEKLHVIAHGSSNGIDTGYFSRAAVSVSDQVKLKGNLGINEDDFVFVFVGRLVGDKGINELIAAFTTISSEKSNLKLLLVGSFESHLDPLSSQTLDEINQNANIILTGFQKDVRPYFAISNALVFPSYREGFPNVVMQAGAMELPSIVTDINGCNEIVEEGVNGTIIPVKDIEAISQAMRGMMMDKDLFTQLKNNARAMISARYEQKVVWEAILDEYKRLEKNV